MQGLAREVCIISLANKLVNSVFALITYLLTFVVEVNLLLSQMTPRQEYQRVSKLVHIDQSQCTSQVQRQSA